MAIILEKNESGKPSIIKSIPFPPSQESIATAVRLDETLMIEIPKIERELIDKYGLTEEIPGEHDLSKGGNVMIWYELGKKLQTIADDPNLVRPSERTWLWQAVGLYATRRILRKNRGPTRLHLEYCYRLSKLPWKFVQKFHWDDWVYLLDSKSLRLDPRSEKWIQRKIGALAKLSRSGLRQLVRNLNSKFKNKDTSVFSQTELFEKYDQVLGSVLSASE